MISYSKTLRTTAMLCTILTAGFSVGQDGVVRMSDRSNARLADKLFGWMIPSGCGGQGCPPIGKYHMTYADQPRLYQPQRHTDLCSSGIRHADHSAAGSECEPRLQLQCRNSSQPDHHDRDLQPSDFTAASAAPDVVTGTNT
jgi:hypothetical protein